jgi:hypothetical protein
LEAVVAGNDRLTSAWMNLLINTKQEVVAAVLNSVALILTESDEDYVRNSVTNAAGVTVFEPVPGIHMQTRFNCYLIVERGIPDAEHSKERVAGWKRELVNRIGTARRLSSVAYLLRLATQPIEESRHAAVNLMRAIAEQPSGWGLQVLFSLAAAPGPDNNFYVYLQERLTEFSKEGKDCKFALIEAIARNPSRSHLPEEVNKTIDTLVKQGAYYLPRMPDVATMEG